MADINWDLITSAIASAVIEQISQQPLPRRLLSTAEAAEYLGMDAASVRNLQASGELPCVRITRRVQFDQRDLDALIERHKSPARR